MKVVDFSVIIVSYNVSALLDQAIEAVKRAVQGLSVEIWVVDNASPDDSVAMVQERHPDVHLVANADNPGFGRANNQAMKQAKGMYFLILNPDTILQEDFLIVMKRFMETHPDCGAVGSMILDPDGRFSPTCRRAFPRPSVALWRIAGLSRLFPQSRIFGQYNLTYLPEDQITEVDALSGSCMVVRKSAVLGNESGHHAAGLFDPSFFMYGEDLDWCYRIQQAGWKIFYTPETRVLHYKGESTDKNDLRYVRLFYGAMAVFMEKHFAGRYARPLVGMLRLGVHIRAGIAAISQFFRRKRPQPPSPARQQVLFIGSNTERTRFESVAPADQWEVVAQLKDETPFSADSLPTGITAVVLTDDERPASAHFAWMTRLNHLTDTFYMWSSQHKRLLGPAEVIRF